MWKYLLLLCLGLAGFCAEEKPTAPVYFVELKRAGDTIEVKTEGETTTFNVSSNSGIGSMKMALHTGAWSKQLVIRLRYQDGRSGLEGLEGFDLTTARLHAGGNLKDSGKIPFRFADAKGKVDVAAPPSGTLNIVITQTEGYMEITLPANLLAGEKECTVAWVDFYRE